MVFDKQRLELFRERKTYKLVIKKARMENINENGFTLVIKKKSYPFIGWFPL